MLCETQYIFVKRNNISMLEEHYPPISQDKNILLQYLLIENVSRYIIRITYVYEMLHSQTV